MVTAIRFSSNRVVAARDDFRMIHPDRTWENFKYLQKGFEGSRRVRLFYYEGTIKILMLGGQHELFKSIIGFLIETFLFSRRAEFLPTGSTTQEKEGISSVEPDESYEIQGLRLSIEVNFTSGDISKLGKYEALKFDKVWVWEDDVLEVYRLIEGKYEVAERSQIPALSLLDLSVLSERILLGETSRIQAAQKLLAAYPVD